MDEKQSEEMAEAALNAEVNQKGGVHEAKALKAAANAGKAASGEAQRKREGRKYSRSAALPPSDPRCNANLAAAQLGASGERPEKKWKVGDRVCFAHQELGPAHTVTRVYSGSEPNIEIEDMSGVFHSQVFVEAPAPVHDPYREVGMDQPHLRSEAPAHGFFQPAGFCPTCGRKL